MEDNCRLSCHLRRNSIAPVQRNTACTKFWSRPVLAAATSHPSERVTTKRIQWVSLLCSYPGDLTNSNDQQSLARRTVTMPLFSNKLAHHACHMHAVIPYGFTTQGRKETEERGVARSDAEPMLRDFERIGSLLARFEKNPRMLIFFA